MHWQSQSPPKNSAGLRYRALLEVTSTIAQRHDLDGIVQELTQRLLNVINFDYVYFLLHDPDTNRLNANWVASVLHDQRTNSKQVKWISNEEIPKLPIPKTLALDEAPAGWVWEHQKPILYPDITRESSFPRVLNPLRAAGLSPVVVAIAIRTNPPLPQQVPAEEQMLSLWREDLQGDRPVVTGRLEPGDPGGPVRRASW